MRTGTVAMLALAVGVAAWTVDVAAKPDATGWERPGQIVFDYVGQVINGSPSPSSSVQFGNLLSVAGADASSSFTFYTEATTTVAKASGPLRIIDRTGTTTIYLASAPGSFDTPDTFRSGTPVQVSTLHQEVVVDTVTGLFTVVNVNTITWSVEFASGANNLILGERGQRFRTQLTGRLNTAGGLPTGWFGGSAQME